jgi:hypothetical protein
LHRPNCTSFLIGEANPETAIKRRTTECRRTLNGFCPLPSPRDFRRSRR